MQIASRRLTFCYLCNNRLAGAGPTIREHVIPSALLGPSPVESRDQWPVVVPAHKKCDERLKQTSDRWIKILADIHTKGSADWAGPDRVLEMPARPALLEGVGGENPVPIFTGLGEVISGGKSWIRGLHAALHNTPIQLNSRMAVFPPVPAAGENGREPTFEQSESMSSLIRCYVSHASAIGKWNGITAWGGTLRFLTVWTSTWCMWTLTFHGVEEWSRNVNGVGNDRPWCGFYESEPPPGAAILSETDLQAAIDAWSWNGVSPPKELLRFLA